MKNSIIAMSFVALSMGASAVYAADGTINFIGSVITDACTVNTASSTQSVALGKVSAGSFKAIGDVASPTRFTIQLSSCPEAISTVSVRFDGVADKADSRLLSLTSGSEISTGLAVAIYEADGNSLIPLQTDSATKTIDSSKKTNDMRFVAKYMSTATAVTAGSANASTNFTVVYN